MIREGDSGENCAFTRNRVSFKRTFDNHVVKYCVGSWKVIILHFLKMFLCKGQDLLLLLLDLWNTLPAKIMFCVHSHFCYFIHRYIKKRIFYFFATSISNFRSTTVLFAYCDCAFVHSTSCGSFVLSSTPQNRKKCMHRSHNSWVNVNL